MPKKGEKYGETLGNLFGTFLDSINPMTTINTINEAFFGNKFHFQCECGYEWGTEDETEDQTAEYNQECEWIPLVTPQNVRGYCEELDDTRYQNYLDSLHSIIDTTNNERLRECAYEALSYCYYKRVHNTVKALDMIEKALSIEAEPDTRVLRGIYIGTPNNAQGNYDRLRDLMCVKALQNDAPDLYFAPKQVDDLIGQTTEQYADSFLDIPVGKRKFLYMVSSFDELEIGALDNKSIKLLPLEYVPKGLQTLAGTVQPDLLYIVHPYASDIYIPFEGYEKQLLKDELNELQLFLCALGAKTIKMIDNSAQRNAVSSEENLHSSANMKYKAIGGGATGEIDSSDELTTLISESIETSSVIDKQDQWFIKKSIWYDRIKSWRDLAEMRKSGVRERRLKISTSQFLSNSHSEMQQLSVDIEAIVGSVHAEGERRMLKKQEEEKEHSWTLEVEFYPLDSYNKKESLVKSIPLPASDNKKADKKNFLLWGLVATIVALLGIICAIIL